MNSLKQKYGLADLHIHTNASDGHYSPEKMVEYAEKNTKLNIIAITDHNTITGAITAQKFAEKNGCRVKVIIGEEITTTEGHVIGLFLNKKIEQNLTVHQTLEEIKRQNGIAIMAHPLFHSRMKRKNDNIVDGVGLINLIKEKDFYDAIETVNATPTQGKFNRSVQFLNRSALFKAETGGSDTHIIKGIGKGYTKFVGRTVDDLRQSILDKTTTAHQIKWEARTLAGYAIKFVPNGIKVLGYTAVHGRTPKRAQIVHCKY